MSEIATQDVARARAAQIRAGIQNYMHTLANVAAAYQQRDWKALGYPSWESYVDGEYGADRLKLSPEHRQKAVTELRLAGMPVRAISAATGLPKSTVADTMTQLSEAGQLKQPDTIVGIDGRERPASRPDRPSATGEEPTPGLATDATVSEAPTGVRPPVGAGDDSTGDDLGPVDATDDGSAWTPSADAAPDSDGQKTPESGVTPHDPVRVRLYVDTGFSGAEHDDVIEVDRAEWNGMTPAERRDYLDEEAMVFRDNRIEWGWLIADDADMADTEDAE